MHSRKITPAILAAMLLLTGCGAAQREGISEESSVETVTGAPEETGNAAAAQDETASAQQNTMHGLYQFHAGTIDGGSLTEEDLRRADVTMINIWQTTCPPCIAEMPEIEALAASLPENVQVLTWCLDGGYETQTAQQILDDAGYTHPTIITADGDLIEMLGQIMYTPTTVFVDSQGNQIGQPIIGSAEDAQALYRDGINAALHELGLETIPQGNADE